MHCIVKSGVLIVFILFHFFAGAQSVFVDLEPVYIQKQVFGKSINIDQYQGRALLTPDLKTLFYTVGTKVARSDYNQSGWGTPYIVDFGKLLPGKNRQEVKQIFDDGRKLLISEHDRFAIAEQSGGLYGYSRGMPVTYDLKGYKDSKDPADGIYLSDDLQYMIYAFVKVKSYKPDLFLLKKLPGAALHYGNPVPLEALNTPAEESEPFLTPGGRFLFFTSRREGGYGGLDIWVSRRLDDTWLHWSKPENTGPKVNDAGAQKNFCPVYDLDNAAMSQDGKVAVLEMKFLTKYKLLAGRLNFEQNGKKIVYPGSKIKITGYNDNQIYETVCNDRGVFALVLPSFQDYNCVAQSENGYFKEQFLPLPGFSKPARNGPTLGSDFERAMVNEGIAAGDIPYKLFSDTSYYVYSITVKEPKAGDVFVLKNLFFETGKATLLPASNDELQKLLKFLNDYPGKSIEISGHTDAVGNDEDNIVLSKKRAQAVKDFLTEKGIVSGRIMAEGYGETRPIADNTTEEGKARNRRVEFKIL